MFPLNTDGIDPSGKNILSSQNVTINNYNDAVAVKPGKMNSEEGCTENVTVNNAVVIHSVGKSIGSVSPNPDINFIRNVKIRLVT